jgi:hypothetical protein
MKSSVQGVRVEDMLGSLQAVAIVRAERFKFCRIESEQKSDRPQRASPPEQLPPQLVVNLALLYHLILRHDAQR